jgi:hypothetical protein
MAFTAEWLALREGADAAARSENLTRRLARALAPRTELRILDLGTGAGANVRYLAERLEAPRQEWLLVDRDEHLLDTCLDRIGRWTVEAGGHIGLQPHGLEVNVHDRACRVVTRALDLDRVEVLSDLCAGRDLVTASALLDLASVSWLHAMADACRKARSSVLFALTYDGRIVCDPEDPADETLRRLVNRHQRTNKGLGIAAGPDATSVARQCFGDAGYEVHDEAADWGLTPRSASLQRALIDGWAEAAGEIAPERAAEIDAWRDRRLEHVDLGRSSIVVGHRDLAAWIR